MRACSCPVAKISQRPRRVGSGVFGQGATSEQLLPSAYDVHTRVITTH